ncbi:TrbI/VirB10 family protein [Sphingopyxis sp. R3-92]|uniref:TrbI/VirB10 family protein n=1 Tax=Sphingopyxis sp. R3-92 TaxID=3158553 RepID=UPI003EE4E39C
MTTEPAAHAPEPTSPQAPSPNPEPFRLRTPVPTVMRLSRKTLAILGVVAGLGIGGSLIYALKPAAPREAKELYSTEGRATAETISAGPKDYSQVPKLGPPLPGDLGRPILSAQQRGTDVPVPQMGATLNRPDAAEAARQRAMQERDAARTASLFLGGGQANAGMAGTVEAMPAPPIASGAAVGEASQAAPSDQTTKRAFMTQAARQQTASVERLTSPVSPYMLQSGTVIPAALITGIRSDLPGQITAQVTQSVYDSQTGRILLIPQGSRLIGEYDSEITAGQSRVLLAWDRLILPDGRSITLERQPGADASGFAGLQDSVNRHWGNLFKAAAISTILGIGTELVAEGDDPLVRALRRGTQDTVNQTGQQLVRQQLNVQPTLTIRPGHPMRIIITRDLVLEPVGASR